MTGTTSPGTPKAPLSYLSITLAKLVATETEIDYTPIEVFLDAKEISVKEIAETLHPFVTSPRKRLYIFKLQPEFTAEEESANRLATTAHKVKNVSKAHALEAMNLDARKTFLTQIAVELLKNTATEPKISRFKQALNDPTSSVRPNIQIQKDYTIADVSRETETTARTSAQNTPSQVTPQSYESLAKLTSHPVLYAQLHTSGVTQIDTQALHQIENHAHAFTDGVILHNLPIGFYLDETHQALCYTNTPHKLPTALAPSLEKIEGIYFPSTAKEAETPLNLFTTLTLDKKVRLFSSNPDTRKKHFIKVLTTHQKEISNILDSLEPEELATLLPVCIKLWMLGGEAHTCLFARLIKTAREKNLSIDFLKDNYAQDAFLTPRGIKNLQKLIQLPAEQRDWWNVLAKAHLNNKAHHFDFNGFFEAYTQVFLPKISEHHLTLPHPCPIKHNGHMLVTLNRVLDVIERAQNPQEQCLSLDKLDWSPSGAHLAMADGGFKHVSAEMELHQSEDTLTDPESIYRQLSTFPTMTTWFYRYLGQQWKNTISLRDIKTQLTTIQNLPAEIWSDLQKNQLTFILGCTFSNPAPLKAENWKKALESCIRLLSTCSNDERTHLLNALTKCFQFKPVPALTQLQALIEQCMLIKTMFPEQHLETEILDPLTSCLQIEGFDLFNTIQARVEKTPGSSADTATLAIHTFARQLQAHRQIINGHFPTQSEHLIHLFAALDEPTLTVEAFIKAIEILREKKGEMYCNALLSTFGQLNVSKSQPLPKADQLLTLLKTLTDSPEELPSESQLTIEKQQAWFIDLLLEKSLLPGCVFGNGDISKLDGLIIDGLVDTIKKRSLMMNQLGTLKDNIAKTLDNPVIPPQLKAALDAQIYPLLDAFIKLISLLQSPDPQFDEVIKALALFEQAKPNLLNLDINIGFGFGRSRGDFVLSYLLTGKRHKDDKLTNSWFEPALTALYNNVMMRDIKKFFASEQSKELRKVMDLDTALLWMTTFNATHSIMFLFKTELVERKVLPAIKKILQQLNTQDREFETTILQMASALSEADPSHVALTSYKAEVESIANFLNLLADYKTTLSPTQFNTIFKLINAPELARLSYQQKYTLMKNLPKLAQAPEATVEKLNQKVQELSTFLKAAAQALENSPDATADGITRAMNGISQLFEMPNLDFDTQCLFFKLSVAHNLKNPSAFPLAALNDLQKSHLAPEMKDLLIKQIIHLLSRMSENASPELILGLVQHTTSTLSTHPTHAKLCITLLERVSPEQLNRDIPAYGTILTDLAKLPETEATLLATILTGLASNKKDDSVEMPTLLDITQGLGRRTAELQKVKALFENQPYPRARILNAALMSHTSTKLQAYCQHFDSNPFAKDGEARSFAKQFEADQAQTPPTRSKTERVQEAISSLEDLMQEGPLPEALKKQLATQLNYIEILGYIDPTNPDDFSSAKKLTDETRPELAIKAQKLLSSLRDGNKPTTREAMKQKEGQQLELIAYLREIYFRTTGLFPNSTQILTLLLSFHYPANLLMRIKTGEGKSLITPMLAVLQWAQGGTVDVCTANSTLLTRDYENSCKPFFDFLHINNALIQANTSSSSYKLDGINCSTLEDMSLFRLSAKEAKEERFIQNNHPIHLVLDECDDALLDQTTLYKLVESQEVDSISDDPAQWLFPLANKFVNWADFRNTDPSKGKVWDEEEDLDQFRFYLTQQINHQFNGDSSKLNFLMKSSNTALRQVLNASSEAARYIENKHFVIRTIKENDATTQMVCIPLVRSTPKRGCFTDSVQQALQARMAAADTSKSTARYFKIQSAPAVIASQSARGLIEFYKQSEGRLIGISGTPGDRIELQTLATLLGTHALGVAPHAGDHRVKHEAVFTFDATESTEAIRKAIDSIKLAVTEPTMEIGSESPSTQADHEAFIKKAEKKREEHNNKQTQPILLVTEDFDEAKKLGENLKDYRDAGFKIQVVTGKESPEELDVIVKRAGAANTITIGTAMLARGIDINPGDHPKGLFVMQTYTDSQRVTTQIAGRAARNGKPGQWLPIYQIKPPTLASLGFFKWLWYWLNPSYRHRVNQQAIEKMQVEIKLHATLERLYTQAIDQIQSTLMQQVQAWESLILEVNPTDGKLNRERYLWRQELLSEISKFQDTDLTQANLAARIEQFKVSVCKLWDTLRDEKWAKKIDAEVLLPEQTVRFAYLKKLKLDQEINIQAVLQKQSQPIKAATQALNHQSLTMTILDKADAMMRYSGQSDESLRIAQNQQLLPHWIKEFFTMYPDSIETLVETQDKSNVIVELLNQAFGKIKKLFLNKKDAQVLLVEAIESYVAKLEATTDKNEKTTTVNDALEKIKPLVLAQGENLKNASLIEQFKTQGLILTFIKLYQQSGLPQDENLDKLKLAYDKNIMSHLTRHLISEFFWTIQKPQPLHARLERDVAKKAAEELYNCALDVMEGKETIALLYKKLQAHRVILQDKSLFSVAHTCPRQVINNCITAIDSLALAPDDCQETFRKEAHDEALVNYHREQFVRCLSVNHPKLRTAQDIHHWKQITDKFDRIRQTSKGGHLFQELYEATQRLQGYPEGQRFKRTLSALSKHLEQTIKALNLPTVGLKKEMEATLFEEKSQQFAALFKVNPKHVHIQRGHDGIQSYIEMQIEEEQAVNDFVGYHSPCAKVLAQEESSLAKKRQQFNNSKQALASLTDLEALRSVPLPFQEEFKKCMELKSLLAQNWQEGNGVETKLPDFIQHQVEQLKALTRLTSKVEIEFDKLKGIVDSQQKLGDLKAKFDKRAQLEKEIEAISEKQLAISTQLVRSKAAQQTKQEELDAANSAYENANIFIKTVITAQNIFRNRALNALTQEQEKLTQAMEQHALEISTKRKEISDNNPILQRIANSVADDITSKGKQSLEAYLSKEVEALIGKVEASFTQASNTLDELSATERKKGNYQTKRFFDTKAMLAFEAKLQHEEAFLPALPPADVVHEPSSDEKMTAPLLVPAV